MGKDTLIEWCDRTFNPWRGCTKVSAGCAHCYAETLSHRNPGTLGVWGPTGTRVVASEAAWREPLRWDRAAKAAGERHRVFCASLADVFEDWTGRMSNAQGHDLWVNGDDTWQADDGAPGFAAGRRPLRMDDVRARLFDLIRRTPNLDWLLLTKRPERWRRCWPLDSIPGHVRQNEGDGKDWRQIPNVWLGASVESADYLHRIDDLKGTPASVLFLSIEPLLGPMPTLGEYLDGIDWVIVGGESGHDARPCDLAWIRSIRDQCQTAGVPAFVKQLGARPTQPTNINGTVESLGYPLIGKLTDPKGGDPAEWPEDLRVRELPEVARA